MVEVRYDNPSAKGDGGTRTAGGAMDDLIDLAGVDDPRIVVNRQNKKLHRAREYRKQFDSPWDRHRRYYGGDQWFNKVRPAWKARPTMNYSFTAVETVIPIMTDQRPTINVVGAEAKDSEAADLMQSAVRAVLIGNEFLDVKSVYVLKNAHLYGMGVSKQWYNNKKGKIEVSSIDTRYFFWSPGALEIQQAEYVMIAVNRWISSIETDYPKFKGKIDATIQGDDLTHRPVDTVKNYQFENNQVMADTGALLSQGVNTSDGAQEDKIVTFIECWERDEDGQVWVTVTAGNTLLKRIKSPYKTGRPNFPGGSLYPFSRCLCYPIDSQLVGMSEMAQLESPQDGMNRVEAQIADYIRMATAPYMRVHKKARVSLKDLTNRIASYIVWDGEHPPDWMPPPPLPGQLFEQSDRMKRHMDNLSGVFDAARGELPAAKTSGVAIQSLQQATAGRVALKTRMFEAYLRDVAVQVIHLIQQFYQNKTIRTESGYIQINSIVTPEEAAAMKTTQKVINAKAMVVEGQPMVVMNDLSDSQYEVEIGIGSTLPIDKGVRFDQSTELFRAGCMSKRTYIKDSGRSEQDVQRILDEMEREMLEDAQKQGVAQQIAQAAAMGGQPAPGGAPPPDGGQPPDAGQPQAPQPAPADPMAQGATPTPGDPLMELEQRVQELEQEMQEIDQAGGVQH